MRILMVQALSMEEAVPERVYPIGIVCLAGCLADQGHTVSLLDMNMASDPFGALKERLLDFQPELVGLSLRNIDPLGNRTSSLIPPFTVAVRITAALMPETWIVAGGTGFSLFPERILRELPEIDFGIVGEAEDSFPALVSSLENQSVSRMSRPQRNMAESCVRNPNRHSREVGKDEGLLETLDSRLCGNDGSEKDHLFAASLTGERPGSRLLSPSSERDLSLYTPPARHLLDPAPYLDINSYVPSIGIETKRGCPYRCAYCVYPKLQGGGLRCRRPADVVDEMEYLHKEYSVAGFHFTDPVLNIPRGHLEEICREIVRRKLKLRWSGFMREDNLDVKNITLFEKSGCECFFFSADGLCQESLDILNKGLREADVLKAAQLAAASDVISVYHFMVNVPRETETTVAKGMRLLDRLHDLHSRKKNLGTVVLNNIRILPGTLIEKIAREEGVIGPETDLLYPVYYNPKPFETLRYQLQTRYLQQNVFMWHEVKQ